MFHKTVLSLVDIQCRTDTADISTDTSVPTVVSRQEDDDGVFKRSYSTYTRFFKLPFFDMTSFLSIYTQL